MGNRVKQMGQLISVVLGAKRNVSDLLRTQISMSWSFPMITSFTHLALASILWPFPIRQSLMFTPFSITALLQMTLPWMLHPSSTVRVHEKAVGDSHCISDDTG